ncbi:TetR/AcrR family transcriptional regulator [Denitrovibrio acetiphilus]|nr:TetR/AcrR family transcriptional regulator [Denitrovibrio acetiphilus]
MSEKHVQFIEIAIELMDRNGINKTTLDDIAEVAGIATPTLYYYFKNKNQVIKGAISKVLETTKENLEAGINDKDSYESQLTCIALSLYQSVANAKFILDIDAKVKSELVILSQDLVNNFNSYLCVKIENILYEAIDRGVFSTDEVEITSEIISESIWGMLQSNIATPNFDLLENKIQVLMSLFVNGLKKNTSGEINEF